MAAAALSLTLSFRFCCAMPPPIPPPIAPPMTKTARTNSAHIDFLLYICFLSLGDNASDTCGCSDHTLGLKHFSGSFTTSGGFSVEIGEVELSANCGALVASWSCRALAATNAAYCCAARSSSSICDMARAGSASASRGRASRRRNGR